MSRWNHTAARVTQGLELGAGCVALALAVLSCTTTLDPSVVVGDDGGEGGAGTEPLRPCNGVTLGASEYLLCSEPLAHAASAADCALRNATLAAVGSAEEDDFIAGRVDPIMNGDWWLGGSRDDTLVWSWPDGTVFWRGGPDGMAEDGAFVDWNSGEPNNASTTSTEPERCLALTPLGDDWNDRACELELPHVCERPAAGE
jgi:hypothetical protein